jgi:carbamoylphosphate synthase small subunit
MAEVAAYPFFGICAGRSLITSGKGFEIHVTDFGEFGDLLERR